MRWLLFLVVCAGCSSLEDVPLGLCGNGVLEANEDCDAHSETCGLPSTPAACRLTCPAGHLCPSGWTCGVDQICRQPSNTWQLSPPFGRPSSVFQVLDLDRSGYPGIAEHAAYELTWYQNHDGALAPFATGHSPSTNLSRSNGSLISDRTAIVATHLPKDDALATIALFQGWDVTLQRIGQDGSFTTFLLPSFPIAIAGQPLGMVTLPDGTQVLGYVTPDLQLVGAPLLGKNAGVPKTLEDLGACRDHLAGSSLLTVATPVRPTLDFAVRVGTATERRICWTTLGQPMQELSMGDADTTQFDTLYLTDIDGNGLLDVFTQGFGGVLMWLQMSKGVFSSPVFDFTGFPPPSTDLNGDHRDDFLWLGGFAVINDGIDLDGSNHRLAPYSSALGYPHLTTVTATDLSHDGIVDLVFGADNGFASACLSDESGGPHGVPRWSCHVQATGLSTVTGLAGLDADGDQVGDAVAFSRDQLALILGRPFTFPGPSAVIGTTLDTQITGLTSMKNPYTVADRAVAMLTLSDGSQAIALERPESTTLEFPLPLSRQVWDVRFDDDDGDHLLDLMVLTDIGVERYRALPAGGFSAAPQHFEIDDPPLTGNPSTEDVYTTNFQFVDLPDEATPAIIGEDKQIVIGVRRGGKYVTRRLSGHSFRAQDLDGDGRNELVFLRNDAFMIARFPPGWTEPVLQTIALPAQSTYQFFVDVSPFDGKLDLVYRDAARDFRVARAQPDGSFDFGAAQPLDALAELRNDKLGPRWLATVDLDGDGLNDVLLATDRGARILRAQVVRR